MIPPNPNQCFPVLPGQMTPLICSDLCSELLLLSGRLPELSSLRQTLQPCPSLVLRGPLHLHLQLSGRPDTTQSMGPRRSPSSLRPASLWCLLSQQAGRCENEQEIKLTGFPRRCHERAPDGGKGLYSRCVIQGINPVTQGKLSRSRHDNNLISLITPTSAKGKAEAGQQRSGCRHFRC